MPKLSKQLKQNLLDDLMNGIGKQEIQSKYNISKQSYYSLVKKQQPQQPHQINPNLDNQLDPTEQQKEQSNNTDLLYDPQGMYEYLNAPAEEAVKQAKLLIMACVLVEKVGAKAGFQFDGLSKDVADDLKNNESDLYKSVNEVTIELDVAKYFNSPKLELLMNLAGKLTLRIKRAVDCT
eukprot:m.677261 g.677261  ORF g.677261 m.677261 type:complete len:179 (-) comp58570_c0_seq12:402-938(-)